MGMAFSERLLGFDARIVREEDDARSVALWVWPSVFSGGGVLDEVEPALHEQDSIVPFGWVAQGGLWPDLEFLQHCLRANEGRIGASYEVIALGIVGGDWDARHREAWSKRIHDPRTGIWLDFWEYLHTKPGEPDASWEFLGYDVATDFSETVLPSGPEATVKPETLPLNAFGLFGDEAEAEAFRRAEEAAWPTEGPLYLYKLWRIDRVML